MYKRQNLNLSGSFVMEATRVGKDTLLAQIVAMVAKAQRSRAPIQRLADTVSSYFVPVVVLIAVASGLGWYFFRARTFLNLRFDQRGFRFDRGLPLRLGSRDADVDHGRIRQGRARRGPYSRSGSFGASGEDRRASGG